MKRAQDLVDKLLENGASRKRIADFLCDGDALRDEGFTDDDQELIEAAYELVKDITVAEVISAMFNDDGQCFDNNGKNIVCECAHWAERIEKNDVRSLDRYTFEDGSVIVIAGGGWDFGFRECWCWAGCVDGDCDCHNE